MRDFLSIFLDILDKHYHYDNEFAPNRRHLGGLLLRKFYPYPTKGYNKEEFYEKDSNLFFLYLALGLLGNQSDFCKKFL